MTVDQVAKPRSPRRGVGFSGPALHRLGLAGLLRSGTPIDTPVLAAQTAAYLAGPAIPLHRYLVLNVYWDLAEPLTLAGWRMTCD